MRIGINGIPLSPSIASGIPRHIHEMSRQLDAVWPEAEFVLYVRSAAGLAPISPRWTIREEPIPAFRKLKPNLWLKLRCGALAARDGLDAFWSGTGLLPDLPRALPACLTVHDLNNVYAPETVPRLTRIALALYFKRDLRRANRILTVSRGTADRLASLYGIKANGITPNACGDVFYPRPPSEITDALSRVGVSQPFCLAVGTLEPRKNISGLLEAFERLDAAGLRNGHALVLVGNMGWRNEAIKTALAKFEAKWLKPLGYVGDDDLARLYSAARLLVMPSIYEGFGIPVIEARACGGQVAITDIPELREYCGVNAILISGTSPEAIAAALMAPLTSPRPAPSGEALPSWRESALTLKATLLELVAS